MAIDYQKLSQDFHIGDFVQRIVPWGLSPYVGRVVSVQRGIGTLDVQWPMGNERLPVEDVTIVNKSVVPVFPPSLNFSWYVGYDSKQASGGNWRTDVFHPDFYHAVADAWTSGLSDLKAYDQIWSKYASRYDDELLRKEIHKMYQLSKTFTEARLKVAIAKNAAYWVSRDRKYRVTRQELASGKPRCPRCKNILRRAVYKMEEGTRVHLFACTKCLFLVKETSLLGPDGQPVNWGRKRNV